MPNAEYERDWYWKNHERGKQLCRQYYRRNHKKICKQKRDARKAAKR